MKLLNELWNDERACSSRATTPSKQSLFQRIFGINSNKNANGELYAKENPSSSNLNLSDYRKSWTIGWSMSIYNPVISKGNISNIKPNDYIKERAYTRYSKLSTNENDLILKRSNANYHSYPIITRWKLQNRDEFDPERKQRVKNQSTKKNVLQFICIQRANGECYIPGDSCDSPDELISSFLKQELINFVLRTYCDMKYEYVESYVKAMFNPRFAKIVYKGFLFDSRISDNSWVKAKVYNFHDEDDFLYKLFWLDNYNYTDAERIKATNSLKWIDIDKNMKVFVKHKDLIETVAKDLNAHW